MDGGVGISAVVGIGSKFIGPSQFTARHDASCDKEAEKVVRLAERFDRIPSEDVDHFEFQEYNTLHSRSTENLQQYRAVQEEYRQKNWFKEPVEKYRSRGRVREAKRSLKSSSAREEQHLNDLERYSRSNSSRCSSVNSRAGSESGLDLEHARPYRTDSCSIRAVGGSPPSASLEDVRQDEDKTMADMAIHSWRKVIEPEVYEEKHDGNSGVKDNDTFDGKKHVCPTCFKRFNRQSSLRIHANTHTGATPFRCPWPNCGREFHFNSNMRIHYRNHITP